MLEQKPRRGLPHWYQPGHAHFVTYRLAGSIPLSMLRTFKNEQQERIRAIKSAGLYRQVELSRLHKVMFSRYDDALDTANAPSWLREPAVAAIIRENLYHHHGVKFQLLAYCVMPTHMHVVLQPFESALTVPKNIDVAPSFGLEQGDQVGVLGKIMHSLKSYTANRANEYLQRGGAFWQKESYDHWILDIDELERIVAYVMANPVKAGLCRQPHEWEFSSAFDRFQRDGSTCGLVSWLQDDWRK